MDGWREGEREREKKMQSDNYGGKE